MEKSICINPVDEEMAVLAAALQILNKFKTIGFVTRKAFLEVVMQQNLEYNDYEKMKKLENFWAGRIKDKELNADLEIVLDNLKHE